MREGWRCLPTPGGHEFADELTPDIDTSPSPKTYGKHNMDDVELGRIAFEHLQRVVAIDSASDETSTQVPTTQGQTELADFLAGFFAGHGATVERDEFANIIATFPGVGRGARQTPVAFMVHLDTAPGTAAVPHLYLVEGWRGDRVPYPKNPHLHVDIAHYPVLQMFEEHDLVHGPGDAPFGLDDKLGLTHLMTLAVLLAEDAVSERPPVLLIGRPDEEVGREAAILGLAQTLAERGVDLGYTVDGLLPYEVNVENFEAAGATLLFPDRPVDLPPAGTYVAVQLGGVNTHGATAKVEGHRPATRFLVEIVARLEAEGLLTERILPVSFSCVVERDCDGTATFAVADQDARHALERAVHDVVDPHVPRGATSRLYDVDNAQSVAPGALLDVLHYVRALLADTTVHPVAAEESDGHEGYSQPHRIVPSEQGVQLSVRLRDFTQEGLAARKGVVQKLAHAGVTVKVVDQYRNMASRLEGHPELWELALEAGRNIGRSPRKLPIRGGTGVDPFLDAGVPVANLGTGYFAPESEKELTSLQTMAGHARWLQELLRVIVARRAD